MISDSNPTGTSLPVSMMFWTIHDDVIEDPEVLDAQFADLRRAGFDGVAVFVRCSRYTWDDGPARATLARISTLCRKTGLRLWIGPDPRFISRPLIRYGGGAELVLFGESSRARTVPNTAPVIEGRFSVRCSLDPRHGHMLNEVAVEYLPLGVLRCYAVRAPEGPFRPDDVRDITRSCRFFYNARDRYVEAFGRFTPPHGAAWRVMAFFHVVSSHVDYSNRHQMRDYARRLIALRDAGVRADCLMWDEAGYTCTYGSLPFTPLIRSAFRRAAGAPLEQGLWKMAYDAEDGSHIPLRIHYYRAVQKTINDAQRFTNRHARRLWGPATLAAIHDTWHFESADMCDMNHGSLDLWKGCAAKSGGFVDLGQINKLRNPGDPYYANLAAMGVIGASLGRKSTGLFAFNNIWTVGDDDAEGWQREVMDHCVNVLALFGTRWLAHAYGPAGTIGAENSFLGSPPLPGYPHHSTWAGFPAWNDRLRRHMTAVEGRIPLANVLLVFPVETMYACADRRANDIAARVFSLILTLVDAQFQLHVVSAEDASGGVWAESGFVLNRVPYEAVILPFARIAGGSPFPVPRAKSDRVILFGARPERTVNNRTFKVRDDHAVLDTVTVIRKLEVLGVTRPVQGPAGTWVTATQVHRGLIASVIPARNSLVYEGPVRCAGASLALSHTTGLSRILFQGGQPPRQLP